MRPPARALLLGLAGALGLGLAGSVRAAEVTPTLTLFSLYSDNIRLAPEGLEDEDLVGVVQPGIRFAAQGARYNLALDYQLQAIFYADQEDAEEVFNIGSLEGSLDVLPERFTIGADAQISQVVVDPEGRVPGSNIPLIGNRQDQATLRVIPEWRETIFGNELVLQLTAGKILFSEEGLQDVDLIELRNQFASPERERGLRWRVRHEYQQYDYDFVQIERQLAELGLFLELGSGWAPFVAGGVESDFANPTDATMDVGTWQAGLTRSTERTRFEVSFGERSFGSNFRASLERNFGGDSRDFIRIAYAETPRTAEELAVIDVPDEPPLTDPGLPPDLPPELLPPGAGTTFLQRRFDLTIGWNFGRLGFRLVLFDQDNDRIPLGADPTEPSQSNRQTGGALIGSYDFGQRLQVFGNVRIADRSFETAGVATSQDTLTNGRLGVAYDLGTRTRLSGWIGTQRRTNTEGVGQFDFEENEVAISLVRSFL